MVAYVLYHNFKFYLLTIGINNLHLLYYTLSEGGKISALLRKPNRRVGELALGCKASGSISSTFLFTRHQRCQTTARG